MDYPTPVQALLLTSIALLVYFAYQDIKYRRFKQYSAWPQPKPSLIWGHANIVGQGRKDQRPSEHSDYTFAAIYESLGRPAAFFVDLRPFTWPILVITNHEVAEQITKVSKALPWSVGKSPTIKDFSDLVGDRSILTHEGEDWKALRRRFNPGFAPQHLNSLLPCILDKTQYFLNHLDRVAATGEVFSLDELAINLTFDIIGAVTMDADLDAQMPSNQQSNIIKLYRQLTRTYKTPRETPGWGWLHPLRTRQRRDLSRRLTILIKEHIKRQFYEQRQGTGTKSRSVLSLSLKGVEELDSNVLDTTCDQLRTFLFAGHDTTSIMLQWSLYELSRTPRALAAIRKEHDEVFGPDPDTAIVREKLLAKGGEELMSRMPYTSAVIKETLRLYPPAATARYVPHGTGFTVRMPDGSQSPPLDGCVLYNMAYLIQRNPAVYGEETAALFMPERWLGDTDTSMSTNSGLEVAEDEKARTDGVKKDAGIPVSAWRPFERGPRNCIGQELANIEARVILACVVRRYDFQKVGLGEVALDWEGKPILNAMGQYEVKSELYNTREVTSKPMDGTRMRVRLSKQALSQV